MTSTVSSVPVIRGKGPEEQLADAPELLTDVKVHLDHLSGVLQRLAGVGGSVEGSRRSLEDQIVALRHRSHETTLSLAVVGEFSSGKSTFINALLHDDLLVSSSLASTAAVTRITYGRSLEVLPRPRAEDDTALASTDDSDPREFLRRLTTDDALAQGLANVTVHHPAPFLQGGIDVLDTPGINSNQASHGVATVEALELDADAAVVLMAADRQLTMNLAEFLTGPLQPFLHRCAFVITKMDHVHRSERQTVIDEIRHRLFEQLGIENPLIIPAVPRARMDAFYGETGAEHAFWLQEFAALESTLNGHLRRARSLSLAEHTVRLLRRVMEDLDQHLQETWQVHEQRAMALKQNAMPDLDAFAQEMRGEHQERIEHLATDADAAFAKNHSERREFLLTSVRSALDRASSQEQLKEATEQWVKGILESASVGQRQDSERILGDLGQGLRSVAEDLDRRFLAEYEKLAAVDRIGGLTAGARYEPAAGLHQTIQLTQRSQHAVGKEHANSVQVHRGMKVAAGALGLFGGPVGLILGIGLWKLAGTFSPSDLRELREKYWQALQPRLEGFLEQIEQANAQALRASKQQFTEALEARRLWYVSQYRESLNQLQQAQQSQLEECRRIQSFVEEERREISQRCQQLTERLEQLRNTPC